MISYFGINSTLFVQFSNNLIKEQYFYGTVICVPLGIYVHSYIIIHNLILYSLFIGFILNALQMIVFSRPKFQKTNIGFLSIMLALVDFIGLFWNFLVYKYLPLIDASLALVSPFTCFTFKWISRIFQQLPLYTQALITLINYLKVKYPRKFLFLKKNINIIYIMILMFLCEGLVNIPNMFQYITYSNNNSNTSLSCGPSNTMGIAANFTTSMLRSVIPAIIMFILDVFTIQTLFISRNTISNNLSKQKRFAFVLLILDILFFIFNVPLSCTEILTIIYQNILLYPSNNNTMALLNLLHGLANTFAYIYYLIPFFINLFFNSMFRRELLYLLFKPNNDQETEQEFSQTNRRDEINMNQMNDNQ